MENSIFFIEKGTVECFLESSNKKEIQNLDTLIKG
jgi:hypothetical protein